MQLKNYKQLIVYDKIKDREYVYDKLEMHGLSNIIDIGVPDRVLTIGMESDLDEMDTDFDIVLDLNVQRDKYDIFLVDESEHKIDARHLANKAKMLLSEARIEIAKFNGHSIIFNSNRNIFRFK